MVTGLSVGNTPITATLSGIHGSTTITVTPAVLTSMTVTPPDPSIANGTTVQLTATGTFSDLTTQDLTTQVSWTSGNNPIAQVSSALGTKGLVTGLGAGNTSITATLSGIQGSTTITVTAAVLTSITITPPSPSIAKGTSLQLTATGNYSDGTTEDLTSQVSWTSGDNTITQVSDAPGSNGLVMGLGAGNTSITAALSGIQGSTTTIVTPAVLTSITITPPNPSIAKGTSMQLTATGTYSDGTTQDLTNQVSWTSSNGNVVVSATSTTQGLVTGVVVGSSLLTARLDGIEGSTTVTVTPASLTSITIAPTNPSIAKGTSVQLTATGSYTDGSTQNLTSQVSWTSGDNTIVQVSNAAGTNGLVTGLGVGNTAITATFSGTQGSTTVTVIPAVLTSITITPPDSSIPNGTTVQLTATGVLSDATTEDLTSLVSWTSGDNTVAQVSNAAGTNGLVTSLAVGNSAITATFSGIQGSTTLTVTPAVLTSITVVANPSVAKGATLQLDALGQYSDGTMEDVTTQVSWTSGDNTIAQVGDTSTTKGLLTGLAVGSTTITATLNGIQGSTMATVTAAALTSITVTPANPSIAKGTTAQLAATGNYTDGTIQNLTTQVSWTSGDNTIAQVSNVSGSIGLVTGLGVGSPTITATLNGIQGSTTVTVLPAALTSITVTPANPSTAKGLKVQLTATGTYTDGSTQNLTSQVSWISSNTAFASVSNASTTQGLVTGVAVGSSLITATLNGVQGSTTVMVTAAVVISVTVTPASATIAVGGKVQCTATANYSDGGTQNVTNSYSWFTSANGIIVVTSGLVTGVGPGKDVAFIFFGSSTPACAITVN